LRRINPNAAGIDVGSKEHYVAVPEGRDEQSVRTFACFTPDLHKMARWLKACNVESVAMESTGVYWIPIFEVLEDYGFDVTLVDARQVKNVPGRKTDVSDCKWIQELHSFGLLSAAFRPEKEICTLRSYWRHRSSLAKSCAKQIHLMQKALEQMNVQLHKVLSDITGMTGMSIIRAIVSGERNPVVLAKMRHHSVKVSEETIANALTGNWREEHLFALGQALELYDIYQDKIAECDRRIDSYMQTLKTTKRKSNTETLKKTKQKRRKNQPYFDLASHLYRMTGVDLTRIDGIDTMTVQTVITECGIDMSRFPTEKHFCSWLAICPNNQITGGRQEKYTTVRQMLFV
jgi:transposase